MAGQADTDRGDGLLQLGDEGALDRRAQVGQRAAHRAGAIDDERQIDETSAEPAQLGRDAEPEPAELRHLLPHGRLEAERVSAKTPRYNPSRSAGRGPDEPGRAAKPE